MTEEQLAHARSILDASPAVEKNDYGMYEPRCVMDGKHLWILDSTVGEVYDTPAESMTRAEEALTAVKKGVKDFIEQHGG